MLFLSPRLPYPPTKGDKIRSWNMVRHFASRYRMLLGCLVDDAEDLQYLDVLRPLCAELAYFPIDKRRQKIKALAGLRPGRPLMLDYNHHPGLAAWTRDKLTHEPVDIAFMFSTPMAQYVLPVVQAPKWRDPTPSLVLDMVDVDSEKWRDYGQTARQPMKTVWQREARTLLAYERRATLACDLSLLVSEPECDRFRILEPTIGARLQAVENGVDLALFAPDLSFASPYRTPGPHLALVGHMDYWPNADAAIWFARDVLPLIQATHPAAEFAIVGANPGPDVRALAKLPGVLVTGKVADVRPYVAHAAAAVVPLRIARGIQNKVLEAMALGRPVVATPQAHEGVRAEAGRDLLVADSPAGLAAAVTEILDGKHPHLGMAGRRAVENGYSWTASLARLDRLLDALPSAAMNRGAA